MDRRMFVRQAAGVTAGIAAGVAVGVAVTPSVALAAEGVALDVLSQRYPFVLPPLDYAATAVEPAVDATTMGVHHDRHHAAYVTNLNHALREQSALHAMTLGELLTGMSLLPESVRAAVRNNGGGHANHALFWELLAPCDVKAPSGALEVAIVRDFGSVAACLAALKAAGLGQFGSGWAWLVRDGAGALTVRALPNQDTPVAQRLTPVIAIDVWEHAYYLHYQNRRAEYLDAVLGAINWNVAATQYGCV